MDTWEKLQLARHMALCLREELEQWESDIVQLETERDEQQSIDAAVERVFAVSGMKETTGRLGDLLRKDTE